MSAAAGIKEEVQSLLLTTAEAVALVKRSERERAGWALHVSFDAHIPDDPDHVYRGACGTYLNLSRSDALHIVSGSLSPGMEAKGARMRISRRDYGGRVTYWING